MIGFLQRKLMYLPTTTDSVPASVALLSGATVRDVQTRTSDGLTLHGWHSEPNSANRISGDSKLTDRKLVLFFHGNGGHREHRIPNLQLLADLGAEVLIFDYRGYAENKGSPTEAGLALDADAAWLYATETLKVRPDQVVIWGESLGGGVAVRLASEKSQAGTPPGGLVLRSTFASMVDAASHHYPWLPVSWLLLDRYRSDQRIQHVTCPLLMLHGNADRIVPYESGRQLFELAPEQSISGVVRKFVTLEGIGHNNVLSTSWEEIQSSVEAFLISIDTD